MQLLVLAASLSVLVASSQAAKCSEAATCSALAENAGEASKKGDMQALCKMQMDMANCLESAMADCKANGIQLPAEAITSFQTSITNLKDQIATMCKGYETTDTGDGSTDTGNQGGTGTGTGGSGGSGTGTVPETAKCMEMSKCAFDMKKMSDAMEAKRIKEACNMVIPSTKCLKSAYADCRKNGILPEDQLNQLSQQVDYAEKMLKQHCSDDGDGSGGMELSSTSLYLAVSSLIAFAVVFVF